MLKTFKELSLAFFIIVGLFVLGLMISAYFLIRHDISREYYGYIVIGISALIAILLAFVFHKRKHAMPAPLPFILTAVLPCLLFRSCGINSLLNFFLPLIIYYIVYALLSQRKKHQKNDIKRIRRNYERLRQK